MHCANCSSLFELDVGAAPEPPAPDGAEVAIVLELVDEPPQPASNSIAPMIAAAGRLAPVGRRVRAGTWFRVLILAVRSISKLFASSRVISLDIKAVTLARLMSWRVIPHPGRGTRPKPSSLSRHASAVPQFERTPPAQARN